MTGYLHGYDGGVLALPPALGWKLEYTAGVPCDSFQMECPWEGVGLDALEGAVEFTARWEGEAVFRGVVDEFRLREDGGGRRLLLAGRGMAALLLDNEAESADYGTATLEDILRDHVRPYGIQVAEGAALPAVEGFSVAAGSSEWQVLYQFAQYYGGVTPRFDRAGRLVLTPWVDGAALVVDGTTPVTAADYCGKRYGVLSEVLVRDRTRLALERVKNQDFLDRGGRRRMVLTMPGRSNYLAMRYRGDFQIQRSRAREVELELTVAEPFFAWPGELVQVARKDCGFNGRYRVLETAVEEDGDGRRTRMTLGLPEARV